VSENYRQAKNKIFRPPDPAASEAGLDPLDETQRAHTYILTAPVSGGRCPKPPQNAHGSARWPPVTWPSKSLSLPSEPLQQILRTPGRMTAMPAIFAGSTNPSSRRTLCAITTPPCAGKTISTFTPPCACSVIRPSKQQWTFTLI